MTTAIDRINDNHPMVVRTARRFFGVGVEFDDLIAAGRFGVARAHERFDPTRGVSFGYFARDWVFYEVSRCVVECSRAIRIPAEKLWALHREGKLHRENLARLDAPSGDTDGTTMHETIPGPSVDAEEAAERDRIRALVAPLLDHLSDRERFVIEGLYWRNQRLGTIGRDLGVSRTRVQQFRDRALGKILKRARKTGVARELEEAAA